MAYVNISNNAFPFLDTLKQQFPDLNVLVSEIQDELNLKLWHQLSGHLIELSDCALLHQGEYLINLYNHVIKSIEVVFNPMKIMIILKNLIKNYSNNLESALVFLEDINKRLNLKGEELIFMECLKVECLLGLSNLYESDDRLKKIKVSLEKLFDVDHIVYAYFYKLSAIYYEKKLCFDEFYNYALQFFAYCKDELLPKEEKLNMCYKMTVASLIGEKMYNFTELVDKEFFKVLIGGQFEWIYNLILSLNSGKVEQFTKMIQNYKNNIISEPILASKLDLLDQKIKITALLDLIFQKSKNERVFTYKEIGTNCCCDYNQVEILVMKALSLGLIRGHIDQIENSVVITWIQPKYLDREKTLVLSERLDNWIKKTNDVLSEFEQATRPLIK